MITQNVDIRGFVNKIRNFAFDIQKSASANVAALNPPDATRLISYFKAIRTEISTIQSNPFVDAPEWHPTDIELGEFSKYDDIENEALKDILWHFEILEVEVINSQSSRLPSRFLPADLIRVEALVTKMENIANIYIAEATPTDRPESAPQKSGVTRGRNGIGRKSK